jgi:hypothetical protein
MIQQMLNCGMPLILADYAISRDLSFTVGGYRFGFVDADQTFRGEVTLLQLGPLGHFYHVPVSAAQGWMITALLLAAILAAVGWLCVRWRRAA